MKIKSIDDAVNFISAWTGVKCLPLNTNQLPLNTPKAVRKLYKALGYFWQSPPFPFEPGILDHNTKRGLLDVVNPLTVDTDNAVTPLIYENQGVWKFGYTKDHQLMFSGDWAFDEKCISYNDWAPFPASIEEALIYFLMSNFFLYMHTSDDDIDFNTNYHSDEFPIILWFHSAWGEQSFLTNISTTKLVYEGVGIIYHNTDSK